MMTEIMMSTKALENIMDLAKKESVNFQWHVQHQSGLGNTPRSDF